MSTKCMLEKFLDFSFRCQDYVILFHMSEYIVVRKNIILSFLWCDVHYTDFKVLQTASVQYILVHAPHAKYSSNTCELALNSMWCSWEMQWKRF